MWYPGEYCPSGCSKAKNPWGLRSLGFWPWNSLGTIFTSIPPRLFHILYQDFTVLCWSFQVTSIAVGSAFAYSQAGGRGQTEGQGARSQQWTANQGAGGQQWPANQEAGGRDRAGQGHNPKSYGDFGGPREKTGHRDTVDQMLLWK